MEKWRLLRLKENHFRVIPRVRVTTLPLYIWEIQWLGTLVSFIYSNQWEYEDYEEQCNKFIKKYGSI